MAVAQRAENEVNTGGSRSLVDTLPGDSVRSAALLADFPSWCVDLGHTLVAMSTYQLWVALAEGTVAPETKVWREGMPWWDPVCNVPEFALAMPEGMRWSAPPPSGPRSFGRSPQAASVPEPAAVRGEDLLRDIGPLQEWPEMAQEPLSAPASSTVASAAEFSTPAPVVVEHEPFELSRSRSRRRILPRLDRRSAVSVAAGAAVAIFALAVATTGASPGRVRQGVSEPPARVAAAGAPEASALPAPAVSSGAAAPASPESARSALGSGAARGPIVTDGERGPRKPRPWERGQRRIRQ
jgi:hypothetical protein